MNLKIVRSKEVGLIADFVGELYEPVSAERFGDHLTALCARLLRDYITTCVLDETHLRTGAYRAACNRMDELEPHLPALEAHIAEHPGWAYAAAGGTERVLMISDFLTQRQWRRTALFGCGFRQMRTWYQVAVALPGPQHLCGLTLMRDKPLPEELRALLQILAPHIERAHQFAQVRKPTPLPENLTAREREVLDWIAQGKRDAEIAVILGISARTVSKHVGNILGKLTVETRGAAAALIRGRP